MKISITSKKENPILKRVELEGELSFSGATPSENEVRKAIASDLSVQEETVVVKKIDMIFGETRAIVTAFAYSSKAYLEAIEPKQKKAPAAKSGAAPASAAPAPAAEEKKEAPKQEEKKSEAKSK